MSEEHFIFEEVTELNAIAEGIPGKRTFYLVVGQGSAWVKAWLGKEQMLALSTAVQQLLVSLAESQRSAGASEVVPELPTIAPLRSPQAEFDIGRLALGHDAKRDFVVVMAHRLEVDENDPPTLQFGGSKALMRALCQRIATVSAAGRQPCPLCGGPLDPEGHICPKSNGHSKIDLESR